MKHPGKLITFEGLDGCGKSTQLELEAKRLRQRGHPVITTREPGGTAVGRQIRNMVVNAAGRPLSAATEMALMFAARAQNIEEVILPALQAGKVVLCDRFTDSSVAYQGYGRKLPLEAIRTLEDLFCQRVRPDLTLILDIDPPTGLNRARSRNRVTLEKESRFEAEGLEFFRRVQEGYREIARREPARVRLLDGRGSVSEVHEQVCRFVDQFLSGGRGRGSDGV